MSVDRVHFVVDYTQLLELHFGLIPSIRIYIIIISLKMFFPGVEFNNTSNNEKLFHVWLSIFRPTSVGRLHL